MEVSVASLVPDLRSSRRMYLWPLIALWLLASAVYGLVCAWPVPGFWMKIWTFVLASVGALWTGFWILLLVVVVAAVVIYLSLRKLEDTNSTEPHSPPRTTNQQMFERENVLAQNHMISITHRKPGWVSWFTSRLAFWVVGLAATKYFKPGFLSDIGTIHFARWVTVPDTGDVLFMSNYGGSWESYLEDFITKAHEGLTAVWSNTVGFPKTENLFQLGATDGDRFKRFARHSMIPTRFWYSAYPDVTTDNIRANADIRAGLSGVMTEDEAINWLSLFGSAARPAVEAGIAGHPEPDLRRPWLPAVRRRHDLRASGEQGTGEGLAQGGTRRHRLQRRPTSRGGGRLHLGAVLARPDEARLAGDMPAAPSRSPSSKA